uniref:Poly [ADP-ribose] polymerase 12-like n=1 Tax=Danio rerio TaxID=7955 RepID=A0A2R8QSI0_DANRE|nr:poly [ADP-ribose] polymerase 12-like [Danio rerio]|eukprot:XP_021330831.1 poly [ADP-ribose] polymerase 12-like [Danio rerio]
MTEAAIIKNICANNGSIAYADLLSALGMYDEAQDVLDVLISRSENCTVGFFSGQKRVIVRTKVRLCRIQNCPACDNLHLCKGFLFGFCRFDRGRRGCRFSHDLDSAHNLMVLMANGLNTLDLKELRILLLQSDNTLLPAVCHSYNNGVGEYGRCLDAEACKRLHICERYLQGHCDCTRAHDFYEPHPLKTLQDRGVPTELMALMKDLYSNIEALRRTNRNKPNTAPNNRRGPNVNNRRSSSVEFTAANRETEATQHTYTGNTHSQIH